MSTISWLRDPATGRAGLTWNPIRARHRITGKVGWHCEPVHEGCRFCYAGAQNKAAARGGTGLPFKPGHRDDVELFLDERVLLQPLHWRKPRRIFPCSMTDLYGPWVPDAWRDRIKAVQALTPQHTYIELTKRPERMRSYLDAGHLPMGEPRRFVAIEDGERACRNDRSFMLPTQIWPLPNVWAGPSCSVQDDADWMIPEVLATPLAKRLVSLEPLLGNVDLAKVFDHANEHSIDALDGRCFHAPQDDEGVPIPQLDLVIVGGLNGPEPTEIECIRALVKQCRAAGTPVFVKQLGRTCRMFRADAAAALAAGAKWRRHKGVDVLAFKDRKGENPAEWPEDLRVREWPAPASAAA